MTMTMYVGNLPFSMNQAGLETLFAPFGAILSARLMTDRETGRPRGFAFVEMESSDARQAIAQLDGVQHQERKLRVNEAEKRTSRY